MTTTVPAPTPSCGPGIILQVSGSGTSADGQYAQLVAGSNSQFDMQIALVSSASAATPFIIDAAGHLSYNGYYASSAPGENVYYFYFNTAADVSSNGGAYATCSVLSGTLNCAVGADTIFSLYTPEPLQAGYQFIGSEVYTSYSEFTFLATCAPSSTTASQATITTTPSATTTSASSTTPLASCPATPTLILQVSSSGTSADGQYAQLVPGASSSQHVIQFTSSPTSATAFVLASNGQLLYAENTDYIASDHGGNGLLTFETFASIEGDSGGIPTCHLVMTGALTANLVCDDEEDEYDTFQIDGALAGAQGGSGVTFLMGVAPGNVEFDFVATCVQ